MLSILVYLRSSNYLPDLLGINSIQSSIVQMNGSL